MTYEHPKWPTRHKPRIVSGDTGASVTCLCGWSATKPSAPQAARSFLDHLKAEREDAS